MIIKFILNKLSGIYPIVSQETKQLSLAYMGELLWQKLALIHPELSKMDKEQRNNYLTNDWLKEQSQRMMAGKHHKYLKLQDRLESVTQQILNL